MKFGLTQETGPSLAGNPQLSAGIREKTAVKECDPIHRGIAMSEAIGRSLFYAVSVLWIIISLTACGNGDARRIVQELGMHAYGASLIRPRNLEFPAGLSIARFNGKDDRLVFSDLGASHPCQPPSKATVLYKLSVWKNLRTPYYDFDYEQITGRIRFRGEWLQVPKRLRLRLNSEINRAEDAARSGSGGHRSAPVK